MSRRVVDLAVALAIAAPACALAGCGSGSAATAAATGAGASAVPAQTLAFVDVNLDRSSTGWRNLQTVGARIPGWTTLTRQLLTALAHGSGAGQNFDSAIRPWLGGEAAVAVTSVDISGGRPHPVVEAYVAVTDPSALERALTGVGGFTGDGTRDGYSLYRAPASAGSYAAVGSGALLIASSSAALDQQISLGGGHGATLASTGLYRRTLAALPGGRVLTGFVNTSRIGNLLGLAASIAPGAGGVSAPQIARLDQAVASSGSVGLALSADPGGLRAAAVVVPPTATGPAPSGTAAFVPALLHQVPASTLAYVGTHGSAAAATAWRAAPSALSGAARTALEVLGRAAPLFTGEIGIDATAAPARGLNVLLTPADPVAAAAAINRLVSSLHTWAPHAVVRRGPAGGFVELGKAAAGLPPIGWHRNGGMFVIGTDPAAPAPANSLADAPAFTALLAQAGVPTRVTALAYVNVPGLAELAPGSSPELHALGGLVAWGEVDRNVLVGEMYLQVPGG